MKAIKRDLQSVIKGLYSTSAKAEKILAKLENLEVKGSSRKTKAKPAAKAGKAKAAKKATATDTIMEIIKRSKSGVDVASLKNQTGFDIIKIRNIIFRLKKLGRIEARRRGLYVKSG